MGILGKINKMINEYMEDVMRDEDDFEPKTKAIPKTGIIKLGGNITARRKDLFFPWTIYLGDREIRYAKEEVAFKEIAKVFPQYKIIERLGSGMIISPVISKHSLNDKQEFSNGGANLSELKEIHIIEAGVDEHIRRREREPLLIGCDLLGDDLDYNDYIYFSTNPVKAYHFKNNMESEFVYRGTTGVYVIEPGDTFWIALEELRNFKKALNDIKRTHYYDISNNRVVIHKGRHPSDCRLSAINIADKHGDEIEFKPLPQYTELFANGVMIDGKPHKFNSDNIKIQRNIEYCVVTEMKYKNKIIGYGIMKYINHPEKARDNQLILMEKDKAIEYLKSLPKELCTGFYIKSAFGNEYIESEKKIDTINMFSSIDEFLNSNEDYYYARRLKQTDSLNQLIKFKSIQKSYWNGRF